MATARAGEPREALRAAARVIAAAIRARAALFSREIPGAVRNPRIVGRTAFINVGSPGGKWGWTPIHAWMFEEPHTGRVPKHPYFGDRAHWYYQPYRPFMEEAAEARASAAMAVYADLAIRQWAMELGYK